MRERYYTNNEEDMADRNLQKGRIGDAEAYLVSLIGKSPHPDIMHHALIKQAALPLYEMAHGLTTDEIIDEANEIYGVIGNLLRGELYTFSHSYHQEVGRITELSFFALHLRNIIDDKTQTVTIPASRRDDKGGIDFYECPVGRGRVDAGWAIQVKTSGSQRDQTEATNKKVALISMTDIDPFAGSPDHLDSLVSSLLRELDGKATVQDAKKLDQCTIDIRNIVRKGPMLRTDPIVTERIKGTERRKKMESALSTLALDLSDQTGHRAA